LSVGELVGAMKGVLEEVFPSFWVAGEITDLRRPTSGHVYFAIKDSQAQMKAVMWRSAKQRVRFELTNGLEVIIRGNISVYATRGECQIVVAELLPKGMGALELALVQLRDKLARLGYFDVQRKKPLPRFPRRIALVTSPSGAAIRDMLQILERRWPRAEVWLRAVRVQGEGAAAEIADAIDTLNRFSGIDVIIVGRGGGDFPVAHTDRQRGRP
jgi:exodeoxyribonuclease VII large subunit